MKHCSAQAVDSSRGCAVESSGSSSFRAPDAPAIIEHSGPELDVGTAQTCHLLLTDPTLSRHHFKLRVEGDDIRIKDAGSRKR